MEKLCPYPGVKQVLVTQDWKCIGQFTKQQTKRTKQTARSPAKKALGRRGAGRENAAHSK